MKYIVDEILLWSTTITIVSLVAVFSFGSTVMNLFSKKRKVDNPANEQTLEKGGEKC